MIVSALSTNELSQRLSNDGLLLKTGPFTFRVRSTLRSILDGIQILYGDYPLDSEENFIDFSIALCPSRGMRRIYHPQVSFSFDGYQPFEPLPIGHAFPMLEWGMNWCIYTYCHQYLLLHSAVIERNGFALIMPAPPGSGKSTLCSALIHRGWRLLSDEFSLISLDDLAISPLCRPVSLKNNSIGLIKAFEPNAVMNSVTHDTSKGSVTHMKIPTQQVRCSGERPLARWIVFPRYVAGSSSQLTPRSRADSMLELGRNSFNYMILGRKGFEVLSQVIETSSCYDFQYSQLDEAIDIFEKLSNT